MVRSNAISQRADLGGVRSDPVLCTDTILVGSDRTLQPPERVLSLDEADGITSAIFRDTALREDALHSCALSWPCGLRSLPDLGVPLAPGRNGWSEAQVVRKGALLCHVRVVAEGYVLAAQTGSARGSPRAAAQART
jgi:hypothetical protein